MNINKLKNIILGATVLLGLSCSSDHDSFGVSNVTNYPLLELLGDNPMYVTLGDTFNDPGVLATEGGQPIDYTVSASGDYRGGSSLDTNVADRYTVAYTAVNADGFSASANRTVYVYNRGNLVNNIEGLYTATVVRNGSSTPQYTNMKYVIVWQNGDGTYGITDAIGGYYDLGRNYGTGYASTGLSFNFTGGTSASVATQASGVGAFGGNIVTSAATVDSSAKTISFTSNWDAGYTFVVTLTQVN